jgi:hypothetical protein
MVVMISVRLAAYSCGGIKPGGEIPCTTMRIGLRSSTSSRARSLNPQLLVKTPLVHHAGDAIPENHLDSLWWKNTGDETVVLSADLFYVTDPSPHMM